MRYMQRYRQMGGEFVVVLGNDMMKYKKTFIALAAVLSIFVVRWTGVDKGLIDNVFNSAIEAVTTEDPSLKERLDAEALEK